jgi:(p)ppGpp synthase/HD superfamily hydrolase
MLFEAIKFAAAAHSGQYRKGTRLPYIIHPLSVARILIEAGAEEEEVVAGLLHDTLEDTKVSLELVRERFGERVAELVGAVSEPPKARVSWEDRKRTMLARMGEESAAALLIVAADKLDNIRAIAANYAKLGDAVWSRFNRPFESQRWYYRSLAETFSRLGRDEPARELFARFQAEVERVFGPGPAGPAPSSSG